MAVFRLLVLFLAATILEGGYLYSAVFNSEQPRFPLFSFCSFQNKWIFAFLECSFFTILCLVFWRRTVAAGCFAAAFILLLTISLDIGHRRQLHVLLVPALFTFAFSEMLGRSDEQKRWQSVPLTFTLGFIYGFAAFHKFFNFHHMLYVLPRDFFQWSGGRIDAICANQDCFILQSIKWIVVPLETTLCFLTFSRNLLRPRLVFTFLFHWLIAVTASELIAASFSMVLLHFYLACLQRPETAKQVLKKRNWRPLILIEGLTGASLFFVAPRLSLPNGALLAAVCEVSLLFFPVAFLMWPFLSVTPLKLPSSFARRFFDITKILIWHKRPLHLGLGLFLAASFAFGLSPFFSKDSYSVHLLGWQMFTDTTKYKFIARSPAEDCFNFEGIPWLIKQKQIGNHFVYYAPRKLDLESLRHFFLDEKHCSIDPESPYKFEISETQGYK
jgi:hypothetical protein